MCMLMSSYPFPYHLPPHTSANLPRPQAEPILLSDFVEEKGFLTSEIRC
jgi:hypothetical protein